MLSNKGLICIGEPEIYRSRISANERGVPSELLIHACISESIIAHLFCSGSQTKFTTWQSESSVSAGRQVTKRLVMPSESISSCNKMECRRQLNAGSMVRAYSQRAMALRFSGYFVWLACGIWLATNLANVKALSQVLADESVNRVSRRKYARIFCA